MDKEIQQQINAQSESEVAAQGAASAVSTATQKQDKKLENPYFLNELRDPDVDSEVFDWLEEEFPEWFSGAHAVGHRHEDWGEEAELIMQNKRERAVTEGSPGRLLRGRPYLLAVAQGADSPESPEFREPMRSAEKRVVRGGSEVATNLMSLSTEGEGLKATTTATTESRVMRQGEEEKSKTRFSKVFE